MERIRNTYKGPTYEQVSETITDNLINGDFDIVRRLVTVDVGMDRSNLIRGAVLGRETATGKYKLSKSAATDGTQVPTCILADDVTSEESEVDTQVYLTGEFNSRELTLGKGHTTKSIDEPLLNRSIFISTSLPRRGQ